MRVVFLGDKGVGRRTILLRMNGALVREDNMDVMTASLEEHLLIAPLSTLRSVGGADHLILVYRMNHRPSADHLVHWELEFSESLGTPTRTKGVSVVGTHLDDDAPFQNHDAIVDALVLDLRSRYAVVEQHTLSATCDTPTSLRSLLPAPPVNLPPITSNLQGGCWITALNLTRCS